MSEVKINTIIRKLKQLYKMYIGEKEGNVSLKDIADFFNIPIDEERIRDYEIKHIFLDKPLITIVDKKYNITYKAKYDRECGINEYDGTSVQFINLTIDSEEKKEEIAYIAASNQEIANKLTFYYKEHELEITKISYHSQAKGQNRNQKLIVRYIKKNGPFRRNLLTKIGKKMFRNGLYDGINERIYTFGNISTNSPNSQDTFCHIHKCGIVYGINKTKQKDKCNLLQGICINNTDINLCGYFPRGISLSDYPLLNYNKPISALLFSGYDIENIPIKLDIYKNTEKFIIYVSIDSKHYNISIPIIDNGTITSKEVLYLTEYLVPIFSNSVFSIIYDYMADFSKKLAINEGALFEEIDPLSPSQLINKPSNEISNIILANKKEFFELLEQQFTLATYEELNEQNKKKLLN